MKKFISMVMAAAMVVSLVPATAFAADNTASLKVVKAAEETKDDAQAWKDAVGGPEIQIKIGEIDTKIGKVDTYDFDLDFDNAFLNGDVAKDTEWDGAQLYDASTKGYVDVTVTVRKDAEDEDKTLKLTIAEPESEGGVLDFAEGDIISLPLTDGSIKVAMDKVSEGKTATVALSGDLGDADAKVFATVVGETLKISVKKTVDVAVDEQTTLNKVTIKAAAGNLPETVTLKLNKGFEFPKKNDSLDNVTWVKDNEVTVTVDGEVEEVEVADLVIEATSAKEGAVATLKASATGWDSASVEVAKVVDLKVVMSVDEDEDVPVFYSGVDVKNTGLTVDDDHVSLEVTIEETFAGAWNMNKAFTLSLPEGVYVATDDEFDFVGVDVVESDMISYGENAVATFFEDAYVKGDHETFEFAKRVFENSVPAKEDYDEEQSMTFTLTLVADPGFVGDVVLTLEGAAVDTQEVTIAKFVAPYTVKAEQNDLIIDYRYTAVPTDIVVTEAEAGLWAENTDFVFTVDKGDYIEFEDDAVYTVNEESEMEVEDFATYGSDNEACIGFTVDEESDEEAAVVTISGIELFMQRNIPAGPYDLSLRTTMSHNYDDVVLLGQDNCDCSVCDVHNITDVCDYDDVVKEAFINVVTAGRDQDDASFTTKVVVPVGESYIVAGEKQVALDVPAYINAAGYTMLPVRAVATALGINNDAVQWDQATKTVIIMYGQRVITMTAGESVVYVSGTALPASAAVEIVDGRAFLGMRDLARALGVTTINWDAATKTATLN